MAFTRVGDAMKIAACLGTCSLGITGSILFLNAFNHGKDETTLTELIPMWQNLLSLEIFGHRLELFRESLYMTKKEIYYFVTSQVPAGKVSAVVWVKACGFL